MKIKQQNTHKKSVVEWFCVRPQISQVCRVLLLTVAIKHLIYKK